MTRGQCQWFEGITTDDEGEVMRPYSDPFATVPEAVEWMADTSASEAGRSYQLMQLRRHVTVVEVTTTVVEEVAECS